MMSLTDYASKSIDWSCLGLVLYFYKDLPSKIVS
jgi:hypothetical protein